MSSRSGARLLLALALSFGCFVATQYWYKKTAIPNNEVNEDVALGNLNHVYNEVQRKSVSRLIWNPVAQSENLYDGDTIRTGTDSQAQISLHNGQTIVDLEADSAIVISQNSGKYTMDFIKGQLFVKSAATAEESIEVKSGDKVVDLKNAEATLEKSKDGQVNVQVFKGDKEKIQKAFKTQEIELLPISPEFGETRLLDVSKSETVRLTWKKISADYQVWVEVGRKRTALSNLEGVQASGDVGFLDVPLRAGVNFWKLKAKKTNSPAGTDSKDILAPTMKVVVEPKLAPAIVWPLAETKIHLNDENEKSTFKWGNPGGLKNILVEVSIDPKFQNVLFRQTMNSELEVALQLKEKGRWYWRVAGYHPVTKEVLTSPITSFLVDIETDLRIPLLISPVDKEKLDYLTVVQQKLTFRWTPEKRAEKYNLVIEQKGPEKFKAWKDIPIETKSLNGANTAKEIIYTLNTIPPSSYRWKIIASAAAKKSTETEFWQFSVDKKTMALAWADGLTEADFNYLGKEPRFEAAVSGGSQLITQLKYHWTEQAADPLLKDLSNAKILKTRQFSVNVPKDGIYYVVVEGFDRNNLSIARTNVRKVKVSFLPLLQPPLVSDVKDGQIQAQGNGSVVINWGEVQGAQSYRMRVRNGTEREPSSAGQEQNIIGLQTEFKKLMPGQYQVQFCTVDRFGRPGPWGEVTTVVVPTTSDVKAPTIKNMQVE